VENCSIISPDGSLYLNPNPNESDAYWAWHEVRSAEDDWSDGIGEGEELQYPSQIRAETVLFSPNSDYVLGWYEGSISLYFVNDRGNSGVYGNIPTVEEVWLAQLAVTETMTAENVSGLAAWSGNSNAFAYWDADGLKWLDINMMRVPRLLLEHEAESIQNFVNVDSAEDVPPLLELSTTGRYVRYGDTEEWMLLDVLTNAEYDDMLVGPDETKFASIAPETYPYASHSQLEEGECLMFDLEGNCLMRQERYGDFCVLPMTTCSGYISLYGYQPREVYWHNNTSLIYLACESTESNLCFVEQRYFENSGYYPERPDSFETNAFAYDEHYGYMAWATDDYHLRLNPNSYSVVLDFSGVLDSPIVSLEWGAPLWYVGQ
jgi:hypothetical protein